MPNRIIRAGILTSEKINRLSHESEIFYRRLLSIVDDWGRTEANAALLRAALYPLRVDKVKEAHIRRMLSEVAKEELVIRYEVGGKEYIEVLNFGQQRRSASKCPEPTSTLPPNESHVITSAKQKKSSDKQMSSDAHLGVSVSECVSEDVAVGPPAKQKPDSLDEVKSYAEELGMSSTESEKFFDHFETNGWKQGGRTRIKDWRAACRNWHRRSDDFKGASSGVPKNSSGFGAVGPFDPNKPHAYTGGVEVVS